MAERGTLGTVGQEGSWGCGHRGLWELQSEGHDVPKHSELCLPPLLSFNLEISATYRQVCILWRPDLLSGSDPPGDPT